MPERRKPLAGIRVLDLTRLLPGPMATLHLADLGADVIKIEDTGAGDYAREMGRTREGMSDFFRLVNRNKRAIRLDLKRPQGREVFLRLAKGADVLVEGFRPGAMAKLGIDYDALAAVNPRLVLAFDKTTDAATGIVTCRACFDFYIDRPAPAAA